jgi:hypothetical protein
MKTQQEYEELSRKGPRGLHPRDRVTWHMLCDKLLQMYDYMPTGETARNCVGGGDDQGNMILFAKATEEECKKIAKFINSLGEP